jgi:GntR family transcriptional regulator
MLISVDPQSHVPVYRQLMEQVRFLIASGQLQPGDELPSTRTLSAELGVNPMTISKAYSYLERDSVLERRPGRPLVVKAFTAEQIRTRKVDLLRDSLTSTVTMVRQLEIDAEEALGIFREMLASAGLPVRRGKE